jgi:hypothetical protein
MGTGLARGAPSTPQKRVGMDAKILKYEEVRHQIKNGDILLFKGTNFGSGIVQKVKLHALKGGACGAHAGHPVPLFSRRDRCVVERTADGHGGQRQGRQRESFLRQRCTFSRSRRVVYLCQRHLRRGSPQNNRVCSGGTGKELWATENNRPRTQDTLGSRLGQTGPLAEGKETLLFGIRSASLQFHWP